MFEERFSGGAYRVGGWVSVTADGTGVVALAGCARSDAGRPGRLTGALSGALARRGFVPVYDRGKSWSTSRLSSPLVVRRSATSTP